MMRYCAAYPTATARGILITPLKSSTLSVMPMPSMMTARPQVIHSLLNQVNSGGWISARIPPNTTQTGKRFESSWSRHDIVIAGDGDVIPKRIHVRAHLAPRKSQPVQIDFPKSRTFLVFQQRLVRQVSQFVVGKIDFAATGPATVIWRVIGVAAPDPILIRLRIFFVAGDVLGGFQEREQLQRPQRRFVFAFCCLEESFRIFTPARRLARHVN